MSAQHSRIAKASDTYVALPPFTLSTGEALTDASVVTVAPVATATREDGTAIVTAPVVSGDGVATPFKVLLTAAAHATRVDSLYLSAVATVDGLVQTVTKTVDVVGGHYFSLPELRAEPNMDDATKYPTQLLLEVRDEIEGVIEQAADISFVRSYQRDRLNGNNTNMAQLSKQSERPYTLISVALNGTSETLSDFDVSEVGELYWHNAGIFLRPDRSRGRPNLIVEYEHGWDNPPAKLRRAAMQAVRRVVMERVSAKLADETGSTVDGVTTRYWTPDAARGRSTGIMALDAVIEAYTSEIPGIA